jgi:hypothetical protein
MVPANRGADVELPSKFCAISGASSPTRKLARNGARGNHGVTGVVNPYFPLSGSCGFAEPYAGIPNQSLCVFR